MMLFAASFLLALLLLLFNRNPVSGYMTEKDYAAEIERMTKKINESDDIIICGFYKPLKNGLKGEVAIYSAGKSGTEAATPAKEIDKSKPFFMEERAVTQNYFLSQDIYARMKPFSDQLEHYIRTEKKPRGIINNFSMMKAQSDGL